MTDDARENGEQETVVQTPEDDDAIWEDIRKQEKDADPAQSRTADHLEGGDEGNSEEGGDPATGENAGTDTPETGSPAQQPDEWEGVPEPVKAHIAKLEQRINTEVGRLAKSQKREAELKKIIQLAGKPDAGTPDRKSLEELKRDYPEVYGAIEPLDKAAQEARAEREARAKDAEAELQELYRENSRQVDEYHPDRIQLFGTPEKPGPYSDAFAQWVMHPYQSVAIREAALSNAKVITDPQAAAWVISQFKSYVGQQQAAQQPQASQSTNTQQSQPNDRRERQKQGASAPRNGGRTPTVSGIPEDGDPEQIWKAFAEQERRERR